MVGIPIHCQKLSSDEKGFNPDHTAVSDKSRLIQNKLEVCDSL